MFGQEFDGINLPKDLYNHLPDGPRSVNDWDLKLLDNPIEFRNKIEETWGAVRIGGQTFVSSHAIKKLNEILMKKKK